MVSSATKIKFDNDPYSAVEASLSAITLALAFEKTGSDHQNDMERIQDDLRALRKRLSRGVKVTVGQGP